MIAAAINMSQIEIIVILTVLLRQTLLFDWLCHPAAVMDFTLSVTFPRRNPE